MSASDNSQNNPSPISEILRKCRHSFYLAFAITGLVQVISLAPLIYMWNIFDRVVAPRSGITLVSLTILIVAVFGFWSLLETVRNRLFVRLSARLDWDLSTTVFDASFRRYVGQKNVNLHQLLSGLLILRQALTGRPILAAMDAPFAIIFIAFGFVFHPMLAVFIIVATVLVIVTSYVSQKISAPILKASNEENAEATKIAADSLRQAETTMAMGMLPAVRNKWFARHQTFLQLQVDATKASGLARGLGDLLNKTLPSLQIAFGAWLAIEGQITGGMVIAASMLIGKAISPMTALISSWNSIISARQAYDHLNVLLVEDQTYSSQMALPPPTGNLQVSDLVIVPPGSTKVVLNGANFTVTPGNILAVIGPSAVGKSCLARALMGVWKPFQGSIRLDGVEISDWAREEVGPYLGYVPQEVEFFSGTIAENIARFGDVEPDEVVEAAQLVGVHMTILQFPSGYDTQIGPGGFALSGGQKQSLALARAFYKRPPFVVLDEPNSNLDEASEQSFRAALQAMRAANTAIVIMTHDPRLARVADLLLVLRDGRQIGFGAPKELLAAVQPNDGKAAVAVKPEAQTAQAIPALSATPLPPASPKPAPPAQAAPPAVSVKPSAVVPAPVAAGPTPPPAPAPSANPAPPAPAGAPVAPAAPAKPSAVAPTPVAAGTTPPPASAPVVAGPTPPPVPAPSANPAPPAPAAKPAAQTVAPKPNADANAPVPVSPSNAPRISVAIEPATPLSHSTALPDHVAGSTERAS